MTHLLHWGVDVLSLCLEEAQHLLTLRDLRGESDQRLWGDTGEVTGGKKDSVQKACLLLRHLALNRAMDYLTD